MPFSKDDLERIRSIRNEAGKEAFLKYTEKFEKECVEAGFDVLDAFAAEESHTHRAVLIDHARYLLIEASWKFLAHRKSVERAIGELTVEEREKVLEQLKSVGVGRDFFVQFIERFGSYG